MFRKRGLKKRLEKQGCKDGLKGLDKEKHARGSFQQLEVNTNQQNRLQNHNDIFSSHSVVNTEEAAKILIFWELDQRLALRLNSTTPWRKARNTSLANTEYAVQRHR